MEEPKGINKEWGAIIVCLVTSITAQVSGMQNSSSQEEYKVTTVDVTDSQREAILDVREKINYLYTRVARLEYANRILPPGPRQVTPPDVIEEPDAGSTSDVDEIDYTPDVVKELFGPDPEEETKQEPVLKEPVEKNQVDVPTWKPIKKMKY